MPRLPLRLTLTIASASRASTLANRTTRTMSSSFPLPRPGTVNGFVGAVGNTPLIRINRLSEKVGADVYGKAEFMEPGGSVKDRAALWVVKDAEDKGESGTSETSTRIWYQSADLRSLSPAYIRALCSNRSYQAGRNSR